MQSNAYLEREERQKGKGNHKFYFIPIYEHPEWTHRIKPALEDIAAQTLSNQEIIDRLRFFKERASAQRPSNQFYQKYNQDSFKVLLKMAYNMLPQLMASIAKFILKENNIKIPIFNSKINQQKQKFIFTKREILYLFCCMAMCLIPPQQFDKYREYNNKFNYMVNFSFIFSVSPLKTEGIFKYLLTELNRLDSEEFKNEKLMMIRERVNDPMPLILSCCKVKTMCKLTLKGDQESIEDYYGDLKVDFANRYIGGGCLRKGSTQEQIMFMNHPELYVSTLLCEVMDDNEAIIFKGFKKYFKTKGYMDKTEFQGFQKNASNKRDQEGIIEEYIVAIDALKYSSQGHLQQFEQPTIDREIIKAYAGFKAIQNKNVKVVTGNWGCGVYHGEHKTKLIIQWIAASLADKEFIYCPFGYNKYLQSEKFFDEVSNMTISEVYYKLINGAEKMKSTKDNIYEYLVRQKNSIKLNQSVIEHKNRKDKNCC